MTTFESFDDGFNSLDLKSGLWIDSISYNPGAGNPIKKAGGEGGAPFTINCGPNGKLVGFTGTAGNYINQLNGICSSPA